MRPYLEKALGPAEADRALERFEGMLRPEQRSWFFEPVGLDPV
jgi:hypothetical protein